MRIGRNYYTGTKAVGMIVLVVIVACIILALSSMLLGWLLMLGLGVIGVSLGYWSCVGLMAIIQIMLSLLKGSLR